MVLTSAGGKSTEPEPESQELKHFKLVKKVWKKKGKGEGHVVIKVYAQLSKL